MSSAVTQWLGIKTKAINPSSSLERGRKESQGRACLLGHDLYSPAKKLVKPQLPQQVFA
jgi:hypothetical protein